MKLVKLTAKYNGYGKYSHRIEFLGAASSRQQFVVVRNWLWDKFGPSAELDNLEAAWYCWKKGLPLWSWNANRRVIYLKDQALTMYILSEETLRFR